jgi:hypothetical protein
VAEQTSHQAGLESRTFCSTTFGAGRVCALLGAVSDGHTLADFEVSGGGADLAPGRNGVEDLLQHDLWGGESVRIGDYRADVLLLHSATKKRNEDQVGGRVSGEPSDFFPLLGIELDQSCNSNHRITVTVECVMVGVVRKQQLDGLKILLLNSLNKGRVGLESAFIFVIGYGRLIFSRVAESSFTYSALSIKQRRGESVDQDPEKFSGISVNASRGTKLVSAPASTSNPTAAGVVYESRSAKWRDIEIMSGSGSSSRAALRGETLFLARNEIKGDPLSLTALTE